MTHDELKAAHAAGAWIYGIEGDGKLHRIEDPEWSCPADRYVALVPFLATASEQAPFGWWMECHGTDDDFRQFVRDPQFLADMRSHGVVKSVTPLFTSPAHTSEARDAARWKWLSPKILSADFAGDEFVGLTFELPAGSVVYASAEATIDAAMRQEAE